MAHDPMRTRFDDNPGHDVDCPLQEAVYPSPMGTSQRGYRCLAKDGHCVPDDKCQSRIDDYFELQAELELYFD